MGSRGIDLTGKRFGRLIVLCLAPRDEWPLKKSGRPRGRAWVVLCDCGRVRPQAVLTADLNAGAFPGCGCGKHHPTLRQVERACRGCGRTFRGPPQRWHCSRRCAQAAHARRERRARRARSLPRPRRPAWCAWCGAAFLSRGRLHRWCSPRCQERDADVRRRRTCGELRLLAGLSAVLQAAEGAS